jgi:hypothetical protein
MAAWPGSVADLLDAVEHPRTDAVLLPEISPERRFPVPVVLGFQTLDTAVHTWDVATALGRVWRPDPPLVAVVLEQARLIPGGPGPPPPPARLRAGAGRGGRGPMDDGARTGRSGLRRGRHAARRLRDGRYDPAVLCDRRPGGAAGPSDAARWPHGDRPGGGRLVERRRDGGPRGRSAPWRWPSGRETPRRWPPGCAAARAILARGDGVRRGGRTRRAAAAGRGVAPPGDRRRGRRPRVQPRLTGRTTPSGSRRTGRRRSAARALYTGVFGDETAVVRMHSGNGAHEEMDRRAIACFDQALVDVGLDARTRAALSDYFAWATTHEMAAYHASAERRARRPAAPALDLGRPPDARPRVRTGASRV